MAIQGLKKKLIIGAVIVGTLFLAFILYRHLSTGVITVTATNEADSVSITRVTDGESAKAYEKAAEYSLTERLPPGTYILKAFTRTAVVDKTIHLKARQNISVELTVAPSLDPESVLPTGVNSMAADGQQLSFLDQTSGQLMYVDSVGEVHSFDNSASAFLVDAKWLSPNYAVAQDNAQVLYVLRDGVVRPLNLPFAVEETVSVGYAVGPDATIYVSQGSVVYAGREGQPFKKIYTAGFNYLRLAASENNLAISYTGAEGEEGVDQSSTKPRLTVIDVSSGKQIFRKNIAIFEAAWSSNGERLLVRSKEGVDILGSSGAITGHLASPDVGAVSWISNADFVYATKNTLWRYSGASRVSDKLTQTGSSTIETLALNVADSAVYIGSAREDTSIVERVSLVGKVSDARMQVLNIFLPEKRGECRISYTNFKQPVIIVFYRSDSELQNCVDIATVELQYYEVNMRGLRILPVKQGE